MAKQLKINIKNAQIAQALQSGKPKEEAAEEKSEGAGRAPRAKRESTVAKASEETGKAASKDSKDQKKEEAPKVKARTKSAFSGPLPETKSKEAPKETKESEPRRPESPTMKANAALRRELFGEEAEEELVRSQKATKRPNPLLSDVEASTPTGESSPSTSLQEYSAAAAKESEKEQIPPKAVEPIESISKSQAPRTPEPTIPPMASIQPKPAEDVSEAAKTEPPPFNYPRQRYPSTQGTQESRSHEREHERPQRDYSQSRDSFHGRESQGRESHGREGRESYGNREGQSSRSHYGQGREGQGHGQRAPYGQGREGQGQGHGQRAPYGQGREGQGHRPYPPREGREGQGHRPYPPREGRESREGQGHRPYPPREGREGREGQGHRPYPPREGREGREGQGHRPYPPREGREGHAPRAHYGQRDSREGHPPRFSEPREKLGPTGKHINDLLPPRYQSKSRSDMPISPNQAVPAKALEARSGIDRSEKRPKSKPKGFGTALEDELSGQEKPAAAKGSKFKDFHDVKSTKRKESSSFDARDRHGLRGLEDEGSTGWRKRRHAKTVAAQEDTTIRPTSLKIRLPIVLKDLAAEMKLKSSQLVAKLFLQGVTVTLNDILEDEVVVQLLGQEFGCAIQIDTSNEKRIRITDKTIKEEITEFDPEQQFLRAPVVAFMGHVDHGKTSLIDTIRKSNRAAGEAGAITQHIGAFRCSTAVGEIAILDTPGHEAFSAMRARGADVTDIVVLVVAGDEGIRAQTVEAIQHAKAANVTIVVALNKCDKPNFNPENVYRQLADQDLLPEAWGGSVITVNCSAVTGEGINTLLEMLALQAEVLELKAVRNARARGRVLESEMHKGLGAVATVLVQNGTLHKGDCVVFDQHWGRIKTMRDEHGNELADAGPSTPVAITGLSGLPEAGHEFIVVKNEREAREISEARMAGVRLLQMQQKKKVSIESLMQQTAGAPKKVLNVILRADVQGSLEALRVALQKIQSSKVDLNVILAGVGEVSESDVQLAATSKAVVIGFHTRIEAHTEPLIKELGIQVRMHDIIYHAIDDVKVLMGGLLDKIAKEETRGAALVKTTFKSSQHGVIAGCQVSEGTIHRNNLIRVLRKGEQVWKGQILSLKRVKEDVREVQKGVECGILLNNYNDVQEGDILEAYEIIYLTQEL